jgi:hypothetical protein
LLQLGNKRRQSTRSWTGADGSKEAIGLSRAVLTLQGRDGLAERIELNDEAPFLLDHACAPRVALVAGLQYFRLLHGAQLLLLE